MRYNNILSLLLLTSFKYVNAYSDCTNCKVITVEDGVKWGAQNNEWCISKFIMKYNTKYSLNE